MGKQDYKNQKTRRGFCLEESLKKQIQELDKTKSKKTMKIVNPKECRSYVKGGYCCCYTQPCEYKDCKATKDCYYRFKCSVELNPKDKCTLFEKS